MTQAVPRISVIVPVYQAEPFVAECMAGIAAQELTPLEVILVDDRGGDRSVEIGVAAARRLGLKVRVVEMAANGGIGAARNAGARHAAGDLVWFCDADDTADPRFLSTLAGRMAQDGTRLAVARTLSIRAEETVIIEPVDVDAVWSGVRAAEALMRNELRGYACNKLIATSLVRAHPFAEGVLYEDFDAFLAMALDAGLVSLCAEPMYHYREHFASVSRIFSPRTLDLLAQEARVGRVLDAHGGVRPRVRRQYRYQGVLLPLANMAARADDGDPQADRALGIAASGVRVREIVGLLRTGGWRFAAPATVLKLSTRRYTTMLRAR